jgi:glycerol uptake facilitator-like aquaporin
VLAALFATQSFAASVALLRTQSAVEPSEQGEALVAILLSLAFVVGDAFAYSFCKQTEQEERQRAVRMRECRVQRNATIMASMLLISAGWSLVAYIVAITWQSNAQSLVQAHTVAAGLGVLMIAWYFASTVEYALLPRRRADEE